MARGEKRPPELAPKQGVMRYWLSWMRWFVAPLVVFLYLAFLLQSERTVEEMTLFQLASNCAQKLLLYGTLVFVIALLRDSLGRGLHRTSSGALEAQACAEHNARLAAQPGRKRRCWFYRLFLALLATGGGVVAFSWPSFSVAVGVGTLLLLALASYVHTFWMPTPATGWFAAKPVVRFFVLFAVLLVVFATTDLPKLLPAAPGSSAVEGMSHWVFLLLLFGWFLSVIGPNSRMARAREAVATAAAVGRSRGRRR